MSRRVLLQAKVSEDQKEFLDEMIDRQIFASYSHAIRRLIEIYRGVQEITNA